MTTVPYDEYQKAMDEIIKGCSSCKIYTNRFDKGYSKQYVKENSGTFHEIVYDDGLVEFWSDKHPAKRIYDGRMPEEVKEKYKNEAIGILENLIECLKEGSEEFSNIYKDQMKDFDDIIEHLGY